jgi:hypothetical protein
VAAAPGPMTLVANVFASDIAGWPGVGDPVPAQKDFVFGTDQVVEVDVQ